MRFRFSRMMLPISVTIVLSVITAGCQRAGGPEAAPTPTQVSDAAKEGSEHGGWWCAEHGVPEEECSMCSTEAAAKFKEKGDWCKEHNRAESQCFKCDPSRADKFAKLYEAKHGEKPPARKE